jgi:FkbH-like protein
VLHHRAGGAVDNPKTRHMGAMRLGEQVLGAVAREYARYIAPLKGRTRKCVVLDLDNTLWGGIVGEDGLHGIRLGDTSPGSEYRELQQYLLTLPQRGILLALNSKNNPEDALEVLRSHGSMLLREEAFSAVRINWRPKPDNMREIAAELNIGLDSLVFVDDNPKERELMRQALPEVLTVELPNDPALYRSTLEALPELQSLVITDEDRARASQYRANRQREVVRTSATSLDDYLRSLEIVVEIADATDAMIPRVHQLFQRTNQFNLTTRRYEAGELAARARSNEWRLYALRARDRFGEHGLVAAALVRATLPEWSVDSLLMSCRVIGYGVETSLVATIVAEARASGASAVTGELIPTKKNAPARDFYERHFFSREGEDESGVTRWRYDLSSSSLQPPPWVHLERRRREEA